MTARTILARAVLVTGLAMGWAGVVLTAYILWELVWLLEEMLGRVARTKSQGSAARSDG